jgi:FKBP-type peptidyl-prolyl cis-trans isomerase 2
VESKREKNTKWKQKMRTNSSNTGRIDLSNQEGKLYKTVIKESDTTDASLMPQPGCKVSVHYVGKLKQSGEIFDNSRERGKPYMFELDAGNVIKGWDVGIATMKKGEIAQFEIASDWAYGEVGAGKQIPPNADLIFEIELLGWTYPDISKMQDKSLIKQIRKSGKGWEKPNEECMKVVVNLDFYVSEHEEMCPSDSTSAISTESKLIEHVENFQFIYGDEMIHPMIEHAIGDMKKGEQASFFIKKQSSELAGVSELDWNFMIHSNVVKDALKQLEIGSISSMKIDIELVDYEREPQVWNMNFENKMAYCERKKIEGNEFFAQKRYNMALKRYNQVVSGVESSDHNLNEQQKNELSKYKIIAFNNAAVIFLKLSQYQDAQDMCDKVLALEPNDTKALFRRAQSYVARGEFDNAVADLKAALQTDPLNTGIKTELNKAIQSLKNQRQRERELYQNMFSS